MATNTISLRNLSEKEARLPIFVLDTCSALNLSKICIDDIPVLLLLIRISKIRIPPIVWDEYKNNFRPTDERTRELWTSVRKCKDETNIKYCLEFVEKETKRNYIETRKHKGEISATALTLWLSRTTSEEIILVTDEFRIYRQLYTIVSDQCVGSVFTSFDLLLFLFTRLPEISNLAIENLLREIKLLFEEPREEGKASKAEIKLVTTIKKLKQICRYEKCFKRLCYER